MLRTVMALGIGLLLLGSPGMGVGPQAAEEVVTLELAWIPYGMHAGIYTALGRGLYKAAGVDLKVLPGRGGQGTIDKLVTGAAQFGLAGAGHVILARSKGAPVKAVAIYHPKGPEAILTLEKSGIRTPKDLEGRTIGSPAVSSAKLLFKAFADATKIDQGRVKWEVMTGPATVPSLLSGKIDAIATFTNFIPNIDKEAAKTGQKTVAIPFSEHGVDVYSNSVQTTDEIIAQKPDLVRGFLRATFQGVAIAIDDPKEGVEDLLKFNTTLDPVLSIQQWEITVAHMLTPEVLQNGLGYISEEKMKRSRDILVKAYDVKDVPAVPDLYTNALLTKVLPKKRM